MPWELVLLSFGVALQLGGAWLTILGARTVWRHVKSPDDRFLAPFIRAGCWIGRRWQRLRHALGLPGRPVVVHLPVLDIGIFSDRVSVRNIFAPLRTDLTLEQAIQELDNRLQQVQELAYDQVDAAETRVREAVEQVRTEHKEVVTLAEQEAEQDRRATIHGLRLEAYGFILLTFGTLIQAGGSYFGIFNDLL